MPKESRTAKRNPSPPPNGQPPNGHAGTGHRTETAERSDTVTWHACADGDGEEEDHERGHAGMRNRRRR